MKCVCVPGQLTAHILLKSSRSGASARFVAIPSAGVESKAGGSPAARRRPDYIYNQLPEHRTLTTSSRHPGEGRGPFGLAESPIAASMDASLRWHDGETSAPSRHPGEGRGPFGLAESPSRSAWMPAFAGMTARHLHPLVTPAKAGVHSGSPNPPSQSAWMPAFAGMTGRHLHPLVTPAKAGVHAACRIPHRGRHGYQPSLA
jgi:hypothetical protein